MWFNPALIAVELLGLCDRVGFTMDQYVRMLPFMKKCYPYDAVLQIQGVLRTTIKKCYPYDAVLQIQGVLRTTIKKCYPYDAVLQIQGVLRTTIKAYVSANYDITINQYIEKSHR